MMPKLGWLVVGMIIAACYWTGFYLKQDTRDPFRPARPFRFAGRFATLIIWIFTLAVFFMWLHSAIAADLKLRKKIIVAKPRPQTIDSMPIGKGELPSKKNYNIAPSCEPLDDEKLSCH